VSVFVSASRTYVLMVISVGIVFSATSKVSAEPHIQRVNVRLPTRFDYQRYRDDRGTKRSRYQMQVSADLEIGLTGDHQRGLQLVTLIGSGDSFTSQWSTVYDVGSDTQSSLQISLRQLYLNYLGKWGRLSGGVIPPVKDVVSNTSMDSDGWIRGARGIIYVGKRGELEVVTGAVDHINSPGVLKMPTTWNYHEVEWTQHWQKQLRTELGATFLKRANILRGELRYGLKGPWHARYELSGELLYDFKVNRYAYDVMLEVERSGYRLRLEHSLIDDRFGLLGRLVNDYFDLGVVNMLALGGPTYWGALRWFTRLYRSEMLSRAMLGVSYPIKWSH